MNAALSPTRGRDEPGRDRTRSGEGVHCGELSWGLARHALYGADQRGTRQRAGAGRSGHRGRRRRNRARIPGGARRPVGNRDGGPSDPGRGQARGTAALLFGPAPTARLVTLGRGARLQVAWRCHSLSNTINSPSLSGPSGPCRSLRVLRWHRRREWRRQDCQSISDGVVVLSRRVAEPPVGPAAKEFSVPVWCLDRVRVLHGGLGRIMRRLG